MEELLSDPALQKNYILSGKFNQDPLKNLFEKVRQSGGWSGNPSAKTVEQATSAIRLQTSSALDEVQGTTKPKIDHTPLPKQRKKVAME